jgi:putative sugar O-methyltransferase
MPLSVRRFFRRRAPSIASMPVSPENRSAVLVFRDEVAKRLRREPYPPGYVVSTRWRRLIAAAARRTAALDDPREIALLGMASDFDVGPIAAQADELRRSRVCYNDQYPELRKIGETPLAPGHTVVDVDGATHSHQLDQAFSFYRELVAGLGDTPIDSVMEVGSGYGRFIRVLKLSGKARRFILVDLPDSLMFAFAFLRLHFPAASMKIVQTAADARPGMERDFEFIFCPIQFLHHLRPAAVDLLVNTYSLGEMQQGCVDHILRCVHEHIRPRYFYSLNSIFADKNLYFDVSGNTGEGNEIVLSLRPEWWPLAFTLHIERQLSRMAAGAILKRVDVSADRLVSDLLQEASANPQGSDRWLGCMYLAALWSEDAKSIESFLVGLRGRHIAERLDKAERYDFSRIGEVRFLTRRLASLADRG